MRPNAAHGPGLRTDRRANRPSDCGARLVQSAADAATGRCFDTPSDDRGGTVEPSPRRTGNNGASIHERMIAAMTLPGADQSSRNDGVSAAT